MARMNGSFEDYQKGQRKAGASNYNSGIPGGFMMANVNTRFQEDALSHNHDDSDDDESAKKAAEAVK